MKAVPFSSEPDNVWTITDDIGDIEDGIVVAQVRVMDGDPPQIAGLFASAPDLLAEIAMLKAQVQRMREMLKQLEWCDIGTTFSARNRGDIKVHRCPICNHSREYWSWRHSDDCELAALLKETADA